MSQQCETEKPAPFALGGTHRQCRNDASFTVSGRTPIEKKQNPMLICGDCLKEFLRRNPDYAECVAALIEETPCKTTTKKTH